MTFTKPTVWKKNQAKVFLSLPGGAFGAVYKACHRISKDIRAVKIIEKKTVSNEERIKLMREIEILKQMVNN